MAELPRQGSCADCGFDWGLGVDDAIELVRKAPYSLTALFKDHAGPPSDDPTRWSATGYLWHLVDVLRFGTERLRTLALDSAREIPGWDQEEMARARRYEQLSSIVGVETFRSAADEWVKVARTVPIDAVVRHPTLGDLTSYDCIRRNAHEVQHHGADIRAVIRGQ